MTDLSGIRNEYRRGKLDREHVAQEPVDQFSRWLEEAMRAEIEEPTAMTLATAGREGRPSARMVLLKGFDHQGFVFFTNYFSRKAREIEENPHAALLFFWKELERQVRIEGRLVKVDETESDAYFALRPPESQVSAIVSPQSEVVPDRKYLEERMRQYLEDHTGPNMRPGHWGGFRLVPDLFEFWQGRPGRLHDRIQYTPSEDASWRIARLAP